MRSGTSKRWLTSALGVTLVLSACPGSKTQIHGTHEDPPGRPVRQIGLLTKDFGWALTEGRFAITTDFGKTWRDQTPIDIPAGELRGAFVLDTKHAWLAGRAQDGGVVVYRTDALGQGWRASTIKGSFGDPKNISLSFVDSTHGWVDVPTDATTDRAELHKTTDGGATWTKVSLPGDQGTNIRFTSQSAGLVITGLARDSLQSTHDAGTHWVPVLVPAAPIPCPPQPRRCAPPFSAPVFSFPTSVRSTDWVAATYSRPSSAIAFKKRSERGWEQQSLYGLRAPITQGRSVATAVVGENKIYDDGPGIVHPEQGLPSSSLARGLSGPVDVITFADLLRGWAINSDRRLFATRDGGANWVKLFP